MNYEPKYSPDSEGAATEYAELIKAMYKKAKNFSDLYEFFKGKGVPISYHILTRSVRISPPRRLLLRNVESIYKAYDIFTAEFLTVEQMLKFLANERGYTRQAVSDHLLNECGHKASAPNISKMVYGEVNSPNRTTTKLIKKLYQSEVLKATNIKPSDYKPLDRTPLPGPRQKKVFKYDFLN